MKNILVSIIIASLLGCILYISSKYEIDDSKQAVITRFGKIVGAQAENGAYYKLPIIDEVHFYQKDVFVSKNSQEIPTREKKYLLMKGSSFWKIKDPIQFHKTVLNSESGSRLVLDIMVAAQRNSISARYLEEIVTGEKPGRIQDGKCKSQVTMEIMELTKEKVMKFGIELVKFDATITYPTI